MATQFSVNDNIDWKNRFFTIWGGQAISIIGSQLVQFALIWYLTVQTGSTTVLATASLVGLLPNVILGPFIGTLVDRWDRRRIMLVSDTVISLVTIGLAVLFALDAVEQYRCCDGAHWTSGRRSGSQPVFYSGMVLTWRAALHSNGHMRVVYPCGNANGITRHYHAG